MSVNIESSYKFTEDDFDGSNAAPLLIVGRERIASLEERQDKLADNFTGAVQERLRGVVDDDVVDFVATSIRNRMHQREGQNGLMYMHRLYDTPRFDLIENASQAEVIKACHDAKYGQANLAQQAIAATAWGMYGWEGKNLTIIDTFRRDLEEPMWEEVSDFAGVDARPRFETMRGFKVHQFVGGERLNVPIRAMRIEMKRTIKDDLGNGTHLKARTFGNINTTPASGFRKQDIRDIYDAKRDGEDLNNHPALLQVFERLVNDDLPRGVAMARNETVYGYNPKTEEQFQQKRAENARKADARS